MLYELAEYTKKNNLVSMPGFKSKKIKWVIVLSEKGEFIGIEETNREFPCCPVLEQRELIGGSETRSHFLADSCEIVLNIIDEKDKAPFKHNKTIISKHDYFKKLLSDAGKHEPMLVLCRKALDDPGVLAKMQKHIKNVKAKLSDNISFRVGSVYPVDLNTWHEWWQAFRRSINSKKQDKPGSMICILDGEPVTPLYSHSKITGLNIVGGQSMGTVLIGFDKDAFQSFGLKQSQNAACSENAVALYRAALDELVKKAPRPLAGALYLHWYKEAIPAECDLLKGFDTGEDEISIRNALSNATRLINAAREGVRPSLLNNRYYILVLSGAGGRIMVRDWIQGNYSELVANVQLWFDDLLIVSESGRGRSGYAKLWAYLVRLVAFRKGEKIQKLSERINNELAPLMPRIWHSIINGLPLPDTIAARALGYIRSEMLNNSEEGNNGQKGGNIDALACSLLKAWYIRKQRAKGGIENMGEEVNLNHPSTAYHAGRMMAVLAELQRAALGDVGAGVVQRYYAAASSTPALVLGRLVRQAQYHLDKLENKGHFVWYEKMLQEISEKIGGSMPKTLTLEEQTLFALGYYQQKANMYKPSEKTDTVNNTNGE